jgi:RNA polymerase sigma factor (TIGR02999 family)
MSDESIQETTRLLQNWARGDQKALDELMPRVHRELRSMARRALQNERDGYTLQATELVHEVYLRLVNVNQLNWKDRAHFFAVAATLMRRVLLDRARRRLSAKRGGRPLQVDLDKTVSLSCQRSNEILALDGALTSLAGLDPRKARIVELRFFVGLDVKEIAEVVGVSPDTVMRDWKTARAWLLSELQGQG